jgi:hypothetical protein
LPQMKGRWSIQYVITVSAFETLTAKWKRQALPATRAVQ